VANYGNAFVEANLYRMKRFATVFTDIRKEGENAPVGLILCTEASRNQIELLELDKAGIAVAEYWTNLPPKKVLESKIKEILSEAKERMERKKLFSNVNKRIDYIENDDEK
jgi:hypothetical protein